LLPVFRLQGVKLRGRIDARLHESELESPHVPLDPANPSAPCVRDWPPSDSSFARRDCGAGRQRAGYLQARGAQQEAIYNELTSTRKSKVRQFETYFRSIRSKLSQLAGSKEAIDAARSFRATFNELNRSDVPADLRGKVETWYGAQFIPGVQRLLGKEADVRRTCPPIPAAIIWSTTYLLARRQLAEGTR
jgi:hypothetical protein